MECPFCAETIKDEALACKHCARDLRIVRPVLLEIQEIVVELDSLRRDLDRVNSRLEKYKDPFRFFATHLVLYILVPVLLLVIAHALVTIVLNISQLPLRLASVIVPALFGFSAYPLHKIRIGSASVLGAATAVLSVTAMLIVTGLHDQVPIMPGPWIEWREVIEYGTSILLAFICGNTLGILIFQVFPKILTQGGKPNAAAYRIARMLGQHVGEEQLRRRARLIQDLLQTAGPLAGIAATAVGSVYAGLKGVLG
jgi:hypothetical protein